MMVTVAVTHPFERHEHAEEAAFPTPQLAVIQNYTRVAPYVALSGRPGEDGVAAASDTGFRTMIDLRQPDEEGVAAEAAAAEKAGLHYLSMPMPTEASEAEQFMDAVSAVLNDPSAYPILLTCGSANRSAAAWALYRTRMGIPASTAIEEARAAGLTSREAFVVDALAERAK